MNLHKSDCHENSNVILHAFDWAYSLVAERAEIISRLGYKTVLVSPPMKSYVCESGTQWWQRYQPQDYRVIDNQLGNTKDFIHMVDTLKQHGLWVYVDVVFNHMANESGLRLDLQYPSSQDMLNYQNNAKQYAELTLFGDLSQPLFDEKDFVEAFGITDWKDKWEVQNGRISAGAHDPGLPTLRDSEHVVTQQKQYLMALKGLGVRGFRIDAAKHMTLEHLAKVWVPEITEGMHIFGEIITDGGATKEEYELFLQPYLEQTRLAAYDFPLFNTIFKAFSKTGSLEYLVDPYSLGQALSNPRAITFTTTHDIPNNEVFIEHVMDEDMEWLALAYVIGRDGGVPLIYADLDTSGITNKAGQPRWKDMWCDPKLAQLITFHKAVHGEPMTIVESSKNRLVIARGDKGTVVINKGQKKSRFTLNRPSGIELITSESITKDNNQIDVVVANASFALLLH